MLLRLLTAYEAYNQDLRTRASRLLCGQTIITNKAFTLGALFSTLEAPNSAAPDLSSTERVSRSGYGAIQSNIGSQRRLRVTKGIYLPADIPLHGIFGSKDVIHS